MKKGWHGGGTIFLKVFLSAALSSHFFFASVLTVSADISEGWTCIDEKGKDLLCSGPHAGDGYHFSFTETGSGTGFSDRLRVSAAGVELSRTCEEFHVSFRERSCTVEISAWGEFGAALVKVFGPGGDRLLMETHGPALNVWPVDGKMRGGAVRDAPLFSSPGVRENGVIGHVALLDKMRRTFISHYADLQDRGEQHGVQREVLFKDWLGRAYSGEGVAQWEKISAKEKGVSDTRKLHGALQWGFAFLGLILNVLTGYSFYRGSRTKSLFLKASLSLLCLAGAFFAVGIHPGALAASFGFWSGLTFPFSLLAYPALAVVRLLRGVIEFELFVDLIAALPVLALSLAGSWFMWTRLIPGFAEGRRKDGSKDPAPFS
jgi:hypothetical protein